MENDIETASTADTSHQPMKLSEIFEKAVKLTESLEDTDYPSNSVEYQDMAIQGINLFEEATCMVNEIGMYSSNETIEEVATEDLKYLLLPAFLGYLNFRLKFTTIESRVDRLQLIELYYKDFLQRCENYELPNAKNVLSKQDAEKDAFPVQENNISVDLKKQAAEREAAISRHKQIREVEVMLLRLKLSVNMKDREEVKREYYLLWLQRWVLRAAEELHSLKMEKAVLSGMTKVPKETKESSKKPQNEPLKPVIIVRNEVQKKVFGFGYPSIPTLTVREFYEQRYSDTKDHSLAADKTVNTPQLANSDVDAAAEEEKTERDDPVALQKARAFDDWKDENRRGSGNTKNKG